MILILLALAAGLVFGIGIAIHGMGDPSKVLSSFGRFGTWDPSLALVMGAALITAAIGNRVFFGRRSALLLNTEFHVPTLRSIDTRLVGGSALFGLGRGMAGFRPRGAIPAFGFAPWPTALFLIQVGAGILLARRLQDLPRRQTA